MALAKTVPGIYVVETARGPMLAWVGHRRWPRRQKRVARLLPVQPAVGLQCEPPSRPGG